MPPHSNLPAAWRVWAVLVFLATLGVAHGQAPSKSELLADLRHGGYVILMRHASLPREPPDAAHVNVDNPTDERQLDPAGIASARVMGKALRRMHIPIGKVLASPTYRALQTVKFAQLGTAASYPELGDGGSSMQEDRSGSRAMWLRSQASRAPNPGTNTVIVTHYPNIIEAFPEHAAGLADGEALVLQPTGHGEVTALARIRIEEWSRLDH
jgi:phosphohistidine phosphatase SixA